MPKKPRIPQIGDKVIPRGSQAIYLVWSVSEDGSEVNLEMVGAPLLNRYRVPVRDLRWVEEE